MTHLSNVSSNEGIKWLIIHSDGAARGNPGPAGIGAVLTDDKGLPVAKLSKYIGRATNNEAEYQAAILALEAAIQHGATAIRLFVDSELLARQLQGHYRVKSPNLIPLYQKAAGLLSHFRTTQVIHVQRGNNRDADALANEAIDKAFKR